MLAEVISDRGQGPALVYLPGIDASGQLLLGTATRLERRFRLLRLRYRPAGDPARRGYAGLAASAIEAVSLRGAERPLLLAESFGGGVALRAALDFPSEVAGLALVNTFPYFRRRVALESTRICFRLTPTWLLLLGRRLLGARLLFGAAQSDPAIVDFLAGPRRRPSAGTAGRDGGAGALAAPFACYPACLRLIHDLDLRPELGRVHQPVALFASTRDRIVDAVRQARQMADLLPDAELEVLDGRGHVVLPLAEIDWPARMERLWQRAQDAERKLRA